MAFSWRDVSTGTPIESADFQEITTNLDSVDDNKCGDDNSTVFKTNYDEDFGTNYDSEDDPFNGEDFGTNYDSEDDPFNGEDFGTNYDSEDDPYNGEDFGTNYESEDDPYDSGHAENGTYYGSEYVNNNGTNQSDLNDYSTWCDHLN